MYIEDMKEILQKELDRVCPAAKADYSSRADYLVIRHNNFCFSVFDFDTLLSSLKAEERKLGFQEFESFLVDVLS